MEIKDTQSKEVPKYAQLTREQLSNVQVIIGARLRIRMGIDGAYDLVL